MKKTLVIDADWLAFMAACVTHVSWYSLLDHEGTLIKESKTSSVITKYKTKLEKLIGTSKSLYSQEQYDLFTVSKEKRLDPDWENTAKNIMIAKANKLKRIAGCTNIMIVIGGPTNFRTRLPLLYCSYKDRKDSYRPPNLKEVRDLAITLFSYQVSEDCEADDLIGHYQYLGCKDQSYIVVTEDKDAKQTPGYILNPRTETIVNCNGLGELGLITKVGSSGAKSYKISGEGRCFLYYQLIHGDPVDTYNPFPKIISDLQSYNLFKDCKTDKDYWTVIVEQYKFYHGDINQWTAWDGTIIKGTWVDILQVYCDVVFMQRWKDDRLDVRSILSKYNLLD